MASDLQQKIDEKARELESLSSLEDSILGLLDEARQTTKQCRDELMALHRQNIAAEREESTAGR